MSLTLTPPAAALLKEGTKENHEALEAVVLPCLTGMAQRAQYVQLIKAFYGFFKPVEDAVAPFIADSFLPDWPQRRKASYILEDLKKLQIPFESLPLAKDIPAINNLPQALGALYVLEGSTLGGRGITKMLLKNEHLQLNEGHLQFFAGYGAATGPMWTTFVNALNSFSGTEAEKAQMVAAANDTFSLFQSWLQQQLVHD